LTIDKEKCRQDGLCAVDCPVGIIRLDDKDGFPELVPDGEAMCLRCGHCVAVCPHEALDHAEVPLRECPPISEALTLSHNQTEQFLRARRSVRQFKDKPVEREILQGLIETARYAPTGSNTQLVEWLVIDDPKRLHAISGRVIEWVRTLLKDPQFKAIPYLALLVHAWENGRDSILRSAPCLVTAMTPAAARNGMVDLTLALAYLELAAPPRGLGTCWAGLLQGALMSDPALKQVVGIPQDYPFHYPMMVGYRKVRYHRLPQRKVPKIHWR
jgi:nitroreductase/NAD-dependent dihydropyrimidine dehydrogenase PreA subunit